MKKNIFLITINNNIVIINNNKIIIKNNKRMKIKLTIITLSILLYSCSGGNAPKFNSSNHPYVVTAIVSYDEKFSLYYSENNNDNATQYSVENGCIIAPTGLFNIGDTVLVFKR